MTSIDESDIATAQVGITAASMDLSGRQYLLIAIGDAPSTTAKVAKWGRDLASADRAVTLYSLPDGAGIADLIDTSTVGVRIMIAGAEYGVMQAVAVARAAGILPCELFIHISHVDVISVFCPHCDTATRALAGPDHTIECSGCARDLVVRPHTSSHRAMYLASVA
ncbi:MULTISPECIES: dimethylamine monooxygenase subunit DmmA family protein [Rhodococcus]|jgi:hypothetical protein|uniref:Dimethylamine monooxygenase subunit DmmA-like C-terminal domain-containing protein n=1 Tax=Rhodococcus jostii (strain RHA1) TaxID=101510 RepID=Q0SJI2_RHOJR|nr:MULTISPECIES: dimethylamine monooxygenase subunit DmmA family protein [Rhodococcus]ABG92304.1 hypothetical protein RHA1_ro00468 [Rhodococcus jostii RHA1]EJJ01550.1 hypothetical protein JVH1_0825 [Rhodococcus sp. JVH1]